LLQFLHLRIKIGEDFSNSSLSLHISVGLLSIDMGEFLTDILILTQTNKIKLMSKNKIDASLKKHIIEAFKSHKEEVLDDFRQEERSRLDQVANDDMDNKHIDSKNEETLREMDFLTNSMEILEKEIYILNNMSAQASSDKVGFGSLVKTDKLTALIGAAHERIEVDGLSVVGISMAAPLMRVMEGKKVGETVELGSMTHTIENIY